VLLVLVPRPVQQRDLQDCEFTRPRGQIALLSDRREELQPRFSHGRTVHQHAVQVQQATAALLADVRGERDEFGTIGVVEQWKAGHGRCRSYEKGPGV